MDYDEGKHCEGKHSEGKHAEGKDGEGPSGGDEWHFAAPAESMAMDGARCHVKVGGRHVSVIRDRGVYYAIDAICYHAGGPLGVGDIEDIEAGGKTIACVKCPWHHYYIALADGEKFYNSLERNAANVLVPAGWKSSDETLQRTHDIDVRADGVFVRLRVSGECRSDKYADRDDCANALSGSRRRAQSSHVGGDGRRQGGRPPPSGSIFNTRHVQQPTAPR
ncbi:hypothetical protein M885DRAFT_539093 [Pelagophyceae sp. CCMP2097]|nr:hypothetical protein M885DRAFT_539093 [Pelagophyceae sp. CCMP2097]|mmetsp:Transcript_10485/g.36351  ORF Transcript_10485/g.36351 Transcript_10485/m.36351 type:complete len:221 (+) Transcript_10485:117-779(+)